MQSCLGKRRVCGPRAALFAPARISSVVSPQPLQRTEYLPRSDTTSFSRLVAERSGQGATARALRQAEVHAASKYVQRGRSQTTLRKRKTASKRVEKSLACRFSAMASACSLWHSIATSRPRTLRKSAAFLDNLRLRAVPRYATLRTMTPNASLAYSCRRSSLRSRMMASIGCGRRKCWRSARRGSSHTNVSTSSTSRQMVRRSNPWAR
mmetsp:Transcript_113099/g.320064  ORF Transcript_113099/g.320064 Transcript_113099/m.320064 type:complete len:209 (+) Transcript_113099:499-1125(+)